MTAGIILAIMITPIVTSLAREVIATVPQSQTEARTAMGATRWEMIRAAVLPAQPRRRQSAQSCSASAGRSARRSPSPW